MLRAYTRLCEVNLAGIRLKKDKPSRKQDFLYALEQATCADLHLRGGRIGHLKLEFFLQGSVDGGSIGFSSISASTLASLSHPRS